MLDPLIGVVLRREHPGAKTADDVLDALCQSLPLSEALAKEWPTDAHLLLYHLVDGNGETLFARANKVGATLPFQLAKDGGGIRVAILCLDHDLPGHREWSDPNEPLTWLGAMPDGFPQPTAWYTTLHGSRLLYVLTSPVGRLEAEGLVHALCAAWRAASGSALLGASTCADWTRLFRLPRTVREDTGLPFWRDERFYLVDGGPELDPTSLAPVQRAPASGPAPVAAQAYLGGQPDEQACRTELEVAGGKGRPRMTDFAKAARKMLQGRESFPVAFEDQPFDPKRLEGGWNNTVLFYVGQVVSMLAATEAATPEGCFALLRPALEQLRAMDEDHKDWLAIGWGMVARMWSAEEAKLAAVRAAEAAGKEAGAELRSQIAATVRAEMPEEVPADEAGAEAWVQRRMIASDGRHHYVMRRDGSYNLSAVGDSMLVPMIRELGMEDAIPTRVLRGQTLVYRHAQDLLSEHAVPVVQVRCSAREPVARVDGPEGERILRVPIHRLNHKLQPAYSPDVNEWLEAFFGDMYDSGCEWLAHSLSTASPICALNLHGTSGSGKGLLIQGLSECFDKESPNDGRAMDRFNIGLLRSPVIWCDEGVPQIKSLGSSADEIFRSLVAGGTMQIEGKMRDIIVADMYPRLVFASNDSDIMRAIVGARDLTDDAVRAIEVRLLSCKIGTAAKRLLDAKGNHSFTRGWVAGDGPSQYVLANHILALHAARKPSKTSTGRFLVEGEVRTELIRDLRLSSDASQSVLRALARMLDSQSPREGLYTTEGRVWVTISCVTDYMELQALGHKIKMSQVSQVLRQFSAEEMPEGKPDGRYVVPTMPPGCKKKARWIELDLAGILEHCSAYGMASERIEALLRMQEGGAGAVAEAKLVAGAARAERVG